MKKEFLIKLNKTGETDLYMTMSEYDVPVFTTNLDYAIRTQNVLIAGMMLEMYPTYDLTIEILESEE